MSSETAMATAAGYSRQDGRRPIFMKWIDRVRAGMAARSAERELMLLDARGLADIGLSRSDVPLAVRGLRDRVGLLPLA